MLSASGARLQLHRFSAASAREEMRRALAASAASAAADGGFLISCVARGEGLYGEANVESELCSEALGDSSALAGFFAAGEIGPLGGRTYVHTYTSSLALLSESKGG